MNIAPKPRFLYSVRAASVSLVRLCSELGVSVEPMHKVG
jgi:hypothetical protein